MRTIRTAALTTTALGLTAAAALSTVALGTPTASASDLSETHRERGYVLECQGEELGRGSAGRTARVVLYENDVHVNHLEIVIDDDPRLAASRNPDDIIVGRDVRVRARLDGHRAVVVGNLAREKRRTPVREVIEDDAGKRVVSEGFHRAVRSDLGLLYRGASFQLVCDPAFSYDLQVTTTDVTS
jgi:hypothetical protein